MAATLDVEARPIPSIEHDCPYVDVLTRRQIGGRAIAPNAYDIADVEKIHSDGECPPTHTSPTSPTSIWSDWVKRHVAH